MTWNEGQMRANRLFSKKHSQKYTEMNQSEMMQFDRTVLEPDETLPEMLDG